jgi:hypothetical protein
MAPPNKSASRDIDLFRFDQPRAESPDLPLPPVGSLATPASRRRYHSTQLAIIVGIFACGGLICSLPSVDRDEEFPRPHRWLRNSYSTPVIASPQERVPAPSNPQSAPLRSNSEDKTAALQQRPVCHRKSTDRSDRPTLGFRPIAALRTKWAKFTGTLRRHTMSFNFSRDLAFGSGSKSSQRRVEEG